MKWRENIDNLVRIGTFKQTDYIADDVRQYVLYAKEYLADAEKSETTRSRFLLAYEGMHSLSMAVLNRIEVRFDGSEGHRQTAFQAALLVIEVDELRKGASAAIMGFHRTRNAVTYQIAFPADERKSRQCGDRSAQVHARRGGEFLWTDTKRTRGPNNSTPSTELEVTIDVEILWPWLHDSESLPCSLRRASSILLV